MKSHRIESIDLLRGIVMVIMLLDHVRGFIHHNIEPTDLAVTTPLLFFTRWLTHFCAPVFVFLAGTAAFLYGQKRASRKDLSRFLLSRGIWLVFVELTIVQLGFNFLAFQYTISDFASFALYKALGIQVIWAIGISMIILSGLIYLNRNILLIFGLSMVFFHNLLDGIRFEGLGLVEVVWYILHQKTIEPFGPDFHLRFMYPLIPWVGVMVLGYVFGNLYKSDFAAEKRKKWLVGLGFGITAFFLILRFVNNYGDPFPWTNQQSFVFTIISFFNLEKYPPSLLFLLMTMGPSFLFLAWSENKNSPIVERLVIIGRVPLFFYILHIYLLKVFAVIVKFFQPSYGLFAIYVITGVITLIAYPICKRYYRYKAENRDKWWLSYL